MDCKVEKIFKGSLDSIPLPSPSSTVFSGDAGVARAPPEFGGSEKRQSLISAYRSLAITKNTPRLKKLYTVLPSEKFKLLAGKAKAKHYV